MHSVTLAQAVHNKTGMWATPQEHDHAAGDPARVGRYGTAAGGRNLNDEAAKWCTPSAENFRTRGGDRADEMGLDNQAKQWASPLAEDAECAGMRPDSTCHTLEDKVRQEQNWSTPTDDNGNNVTRESGLFKSLTRDVQNWSTPAAHDGHIGYQDRTNGKKGSQVNLHTEVVNAAGGGKGKQQLNPDWEEILMGWPIGWTNAEIPCAGEWPGWPMGQGPRRHSYEPPRTVPKGSCANRVARVKACGNGVVPQTAATAFTSIIAEAMIHTEGAA